jgi:hypothetical protein
MRVRERGEQVRRFVLDHIEKRPNDIAKLTSEHFGISRQAANKHLNRLVNEKSLTEAGETRKRTYKLATLSEWRKMYSITPDLEEHVLWDNDVSPVLQPLPENVMHIWQYGFTEMLNNAKDHSGGDSIMVHISKTAISTEITITDNGIGIFKRIQEAFKLPDQRYAILELAKGKLTTDPSRHTGEGIFFSSRMFDHFAVGSDKTYYGHNFGDDSDWILEWGPSGTFVVMRLSNHTARTSKKIFDHYASGDDDYSFNKTVVPVKLAQYGNDQLISRSQAKRVVARLELFKTIVFDFAGVPSIGQAFADEIFRVFANEHPNLSIYPVNANSEVNRMITRVRQPATALPPISGPSSPSS